MKIAIAVCALIISIAIAAGPVLGAATPQASPAADPTGCSGLEVYRNDISLAYRDYVQRRVDHGVPVDADQRSLTPKQWEIVAGDLLAYANALAAIVPPAWAAGWQDALIAMFAPRSRSRPHRPAGVFPMRRRSGGPSSTSAPRRSLWRQRKRRSTAPRLVSGSSGTAPPLPRRPREIDEPGRSRRSRDHMFMQVPLMHICWPVHWCPQAPQLLLLVWRLDSQPVWNKPSQFPQPALQLPTPHTPPEQAGVPFATKHCVLQPLQLCGSVIRLVSQPSPG